MDGGVLKLNLALESVLVLEDAPARIGAGRRLGLGLLLLGPRIR